MAAAADTLCLCEGRGNHKVAPSCLMLTCTPAALLQATGKPRTSTVDHHAVIFAFLSARQLESLVRLSEARARLELREEVTRSDAEDVVDLLREVSGVSRQ